MDENQLIDSALLEAYKQAPPYIQEYIAGGKFEAFILRLTSHFGLHADVAGKVSNEILMTLIGMTAPAELPKNLADEAGVAPGIVTPLLEELNQEVFIPLRESLRSQSEVSSEPVATPAAAPATPVPDSRWIQVTPPEAATPEVQTPQTPAAPTEPVVLPQPQTTITPPVSEAPSPVAETTPAGAAPAEYHEMVSMMRTMSKDIEALKNGAQPKMEPWKTSPVSVPQTPIAGTARENVSPSYISPTVQTIPQAVPEPTRPTVSPIVHEHIVVAPKNTSGDPYREPVE